jgi:hypothetical protein
LLLLRLSFLSLFPSGDEGGSCTETAFSFMLLPPLLLGVCLSVRISRPLSLPFARRLSICLCSCARILGMPTTSTRLERTVRHSTTSFSSVGSAGEGLLFSCLCSALRFALLADPATRPTCFFLRST